MKINTTLSAQLFGRRQATYVTRILHSVLQPFVVALLVMLVFAPAAWGAVSESANYSPGNLQGKANASASSSWTDDTGNLNQIVAGGLTYPGFGNPISTSYGMISVNNAASSGNPKTTLQVTSSSSATTVYCSFLLKVNANPGSSGQPVFSLNNSHSSSTPTDNKNNFTVWVKQGADATHYNVGVAIAGGTVVYESGSHSCGATPDTVLVVAEYDNTAKKASLWVNTSSSNFGVGSAPTADVTTAATGSTISWKYWIVWNNVLSGSPTWNIDNIRQDAAWANITPAGPIAPVASAATSVSTSGFTANWGSVSGATGYYLDVATDSGFSSFVSGYNNYDAGNNISTAVTGLSAGTTYYYRVRAYTATLFGDSSGTISQITASSTPTINAGALTGFGNVTVNATSTTNSYTLSGVSLTPATGNLTVAPSAGFEVSLDQISWTANPSSMNVPYSSSSLAATSIYVRFKPTAVQAYNGNIANTGGGTAETDTAASGTGTALADPTTFTATTSLPSTINVSFTPNTAGNNIVLVYNTTGTFTTPSGAPPSVGNSFAGGTVLFIGTTSPFAHTPLSSGTYYYKAWSYDSTGNFYSAGVTAGATFNQYQSRASGNWNDYNIWSVDHSDGNGYVNAVSGETPSSADVSVEIANGTTVTNSATASGNNVTVDTTGILVANAALTLTGAATINGTYMHGIDGGAIPTATWAPGSICEIDGVTSTAPTGTGQVFGNFIWNCTSQTADITLGASITSIAGNLSIQSTGPSPSQKALYLLPSGGATSLTVGGNLSLSANTIVYISADITLRTLTVNGNASIAGDLNGEPGGSNSELLAFGGTANQTFSVSGTLDGTTAQKKLNIQINSGAIVTLTSDILTSSNSSRTFAVIGSGTLDCSTHVISGVGKFSLSSGATIKTANATGLAASITVSNTKTFNSGATYIYNGSGNQSIGTVNYSTANTVNNLTIANSSGAVSLGANLAVNGTLTVNSGADLDFNSFTISTPNAPSLGGTLTMEVNKTGANTFTGSQLIDTAGTMPYGGALLVTASGQDLAAGDSIPLFTPSGSGSFITTTLPTLDGSLYWDTSALDSAGVITVAVAAIQPPDIQPVYPDGLGNLVIPVLTLSGHTYYLESTPSLTPPISWTTNSTTSGTGGIITPTAPINPAIPNQFFRYQVN